MLETLTIQRDGARIVIVGELLMPSDCDQLRTRVEEAIGALQAGRPELTLDISAAVRFDNTRVLATLVNCARKCSDAGVTLLLEGASEEFLELLEITHIAEIFGARGAKVTPLRRTS